MKAGDQDACFRSDSSTARIDCELMTFGNWQTNGQKRTSQKVGLATSEKPYTYWNIVHAVILFPSRFKNEKIRPVKLSILVCRMIVNQRLSLLAEQVDGEFQRSGSEVGRYNVQAESNVGSRAWVSNNERML
jgi:hypothetical protein